MSLTEEQKLRMQKNREKALEIQRRRKALEEYNNCNNKNNNDNDDSDSVKKKHIEQSTNTTASSKRQKYSGDDKKSTTKTIAPLNNNEEEQTTTTIMEEFELNAPTTVTKQEAMQTYCLPQGTLDVCTYIEKVNPRNKNFKPMKLYNRNEIRRRAYERYGGVDGLILERKKRMDKKLVHDLHVADTFFGGK